MKNMTELKEKLVKAQDAYYAGKPFLIDTEYDALYDYVRELDPECPEVNRVGGALINTFEEIQHTIPMLSLDKMYEVDQIKDFVSKLNTEVVLEPKIDGISIVLYYKQGKLYRAVTRGNGMVGNDVTENIKMIRDIPQKLTRDIDIAVRGEIYLPKAELQRINAESDIQYANCRNLTAGLIRHKHPAKLAGIKLSIFVYEGYYANSPSTHVEILKDLDELGFIVNHYELTSVKDMDFAIWRLTDARALLPYDIDGLVFKVNNIAERDKLGFTRHHPRWAMAFKFESPQATSKVLKIDVQVGRTGRITPVARITPTLLAGSTISNITLHNQGYIDTLELAVGDIVAISKRGDVIPAIEEVLEKNGNPVYKMPRVCPSCGCDLVEDGAHLFCKNWACEEKHLGNLIFFCGKNQMDINGLGAGTITYIYNLCKDRNNGDGYRFNYCDDIYTFDYTLLLGEEGFGEKKVQNIIEGVEASRTKKVSVVLASLGLEGLGHKTSKLLVNHFNSLDEIMHLKAKDITAIQGIGEITAKQIEKSLYQLGTPLIALLKEQLTLVYDKEDTVQNAKTYCITGVFDVSRKDIKELIVSNGGKVVSSVSSKLDYLVCGDKAGSKKAKAEKLGISIINYRELLDILR